MSRRVKIMKTNAVHSYENRHTILAPLVQGAAIGAVAGGIGKYVVPLTTEEKNSDEYIKIANRVNDQKTAYNFRTQKYIDSLAAKDKRSLAEDEFIKMFDGMQEGQKMKPSKIRTAINNIMAKNPNELFEFKRICKNSSDVAEQTAKQFMSAYNLVTKQIRPMSFFLATGAVLEAFVALVNDAIKVKINN